MADLWHAINRGVDKRTIFLDDRDRARFVHDMWEFNDTKIVDNVRHRLPNTDFVSPYMAKERIVDIHAWCIMDNHYHLLLSERIEGGLSNFLRRLNIGYSKYFNERHKRSGTLFQGRTKKLLISNDRHFLHILNYIHCNPLDFKRESKNWRAHKIENHKKALETLSGYKWSSYNDYIGVPHFPSVLTTDLFRDVFKNYKKEISEFLLSKEAFELAPYELE